MRSPLLNTPALCLPYSPHDSLSPHECPRGLTSHTLGSLLWTWGDSHSGQFCHPPCDSSHGLREQLALTGPAWVTPWGWGWIPACSDTGSCRVLGTDPFVSLQQVHNEKVHDKEAASDTELGGAGLKRCQPALRP